MTENVFLALCGNNIRTRRPEQSCFRAKSYSPSPLKYSEAPIQSSWHSCDFSHSSSYYYYFFLFIIILLLLHYIQYGARRRMLINYITLYYYITLLLLLLFFFYKLQQNNTSSTSVNGSTLAVVRDRQARFTICASGRRRVFSSCGRRTNDLGDKLIPVSVQ